MTQSLTDRTALERSRHRAATAPVRFLHDTLREEFQDRLQLVNKSFRDQVVVSGWQGLGTTILPDAAQLCDVDTINLAENSADLALHAMGLHWANDPVGQLIQLRRVLRPDGLLLCACFGGQTLHELRASFGQAESDLYGALSPRIAPMGEIRDLGALLQRAGFSLPVADSVRLNVVYQTPLHLMRDLRFMGEGNALTARRKTFMPRALLMRASEIYQTNFAHPDGGINATFELVFLTGWAPDASQPQPLRPGSAQARLAEALGTRETSLND